MINDSLENNIKVVYTVDDIRSMLGIGRRQAYELANSGQFLIKRIGVKIIIPKLTFDRWLLSNVLVSA